MPATTRTYSIDRATAGRPRPGYSIVTTAGEVIDVDGADTYELEGPLTTFFDTGGRDYVDSWATRLISVRTAEISRIVPALTATATDADLGRERACRQHRAPAQTGIRDLAVDAV